mgnify:CR=1 FL=1
MSALTIQILHEPTVKEPFLVVDKPRLLPSAPLHEGDDSALSQALQLYPALSSVCGKKPIEHGLIHRIDTATRGCVLIAATQSAYDALVRAQKNNCFEKWYLAAVEPIAAFKKPLQGFPPLPVKMQAQVQALVHTAREAYAAYAEHTARGEHAVCGDHTAHAVLVESCFRPFGPHQAAVRPVTALAGAAATKKGGTKRYQTAVSFFAHGSALLARCSITEGYRHQVRCHLAWLGFPVKGDSLYNPMCALGMAPASENSFVQQASALLFTAVKIRFPNPVDGSIIDVSLPESATQELL